MHLFQALSHYRNLLARSQVQDHKILPGHLHRQGKREDAKDTELLDKSTGTRQLWFLPSAVRSPLPTQPQVVWTREHWLPITRNPNRFFCPFAETTDRWHITVAVNNICLVFAVLALTQDECYGVTHRLIREDLLADEDLLPCTKEGQGGEHPTHLLLFHFSSFKQHWKSERCLSIYRHVSADS